MKRNYNNREKNESIKWVKNYKNLFSFFYNLSKIIFLFVLFFPVLSFHLTKKKVYKKTGFVSI